MTLNELYDLNLKIRKGEATKKEKFIYKIEYKKKKDFMFFSREKYPYMLETMILPKAVDGKNIKIITKYIKVFKKLTSKNNCKKLVLRYLYDFANDFENSNLMVKDWLDKKDRIQAKNIDDMNEEELLTSLTWIVRGDRFSEDQLLNEFNNGNILKILERLK